MKDYKNKIIGLDKFIENSLYDKRDGYYMSKDPFGKKGDFITSSNISIFFSEMLAIWILSFWEKLNKPKKINIIDMGGGNGEMSFNILNTLNKFSQFKKNYCFYIHEKSPYLKRKQKFKIKNSSIIWINNLEKINEYSKNIFYKKTFIFLISYLIIDETDNANYFLFKYNLSNEDKKRVKFLIENHELFSEKDYFNKKNLQRIFYFYNKSYVIDLLDLKIFNSKTAPKKLIELKKYFEQFEKPIFPLKAQYLLEKYKLKEGKEFGQKIRLLEEMWLNNSFKISNKEIDNVFRN